MKSQCGAHRDRRDSAQERKRKVKASSVASSAQLVAFTFQDGKCHPAIGASTLFWECYHFSVLSKELFFCPFYS